MIDHIEDVEYDFEMYYNKDEQHDIDGLVPFCVLVVILLAMFVFYLIF